MEVNTRITKIGSNKWQSVKIKLPDSTKPYLEKYNLELVEYSGFPHIGIFFQKKDEPNIDIVSYTVYNQDVADNMSQGFKRAFEQLKDIEHEESR